MKKFRPFILGCEVIIVTDHHALCLLMTKRELAGRLARWSVLISEYRLKIVYKSGKTHTDADALSRYPLDGPE